MSVKSEAVKALTLAVAADELQRCDDMAQMVLEREWAEHAGKGPISSKVEEAFTQLHNELQTDVSIRDRAINYVAEALVILRDMKKDGMSTPEGDAFLAENLETFQSVIDRNEDLDRAETIRV